MLTVGEQGRRLRITLAAGTEDEETFVVPPADSEAGAALLKGYIGISAGIFGDTEAAERDVVALALGKPTPQRDDAEWTDADHARFAQRTSDHYQLHRRGMDLRSEEIHDVVQCAFFWNVNGGSLAAAQAFAAAGGGLDGMGKALSLVEKKLGLSLALMSQSTGPATRTLTPDELSTQPGSGAAFRKPADHLGPKGKHRQ
jgi:hypothetical protein